MEPPIDRYWSIAAIASQDHPRLRANSCSFSSSQSSSMVIRCGRSFGKPLSRHKLQEKWSLGKIVSKPCVSVNWQEVIHVFFFGSLHPILSKNIQKPQCPRRPRSPRLLLVEKEEERHFLAEVFPFPFQPIGNISQPQSHGRCRKRDQGICRKGGWVALEHINSTAVALKICKWQDNSYNWGYIYIIR